ncbi:GNAT family N-acetyltransferase [Blastopirellula marina]|uniref:Acetyltransferase, GNAT family protein n=1 Tax=Blastopirellula marina DSM 3645 TaxID=314230 RepID=A3ZYJ5_9BACT|nr:N-acetyltransferase [Blastopirellula marina]EAQ78486.1 acetyltransferase, GNAT family protein [Blastopirellula marina DSM 3645]
MIIRPETSDDVPAIRALLLAAFPTAIENEIVDQLRDCGCDQLSLVAEEDGQIIGQILFTPATIEKNGRVVRGWGLAPVSVSPKAQRRGVGAQLIETGLAQLRDSGALFVIVLGDFNYYPKFGFQPASQWNVRSELAGVPDEAFMMISYNDDAIADGGIAKYRQEFASAV